MRAFSGFLPFVVVATHVLVGCGSPPVPLDEELEPEASTSDDTDDDSKPTKQPDADDDVRDQNRGDDDGVTDDVADDEVEVPLHIPVYDPDFPGLDEALIPDVPVPGCSDEGYDPDESTLELRMDREAYGVSVHATAGVVYANQRACTFEGNPITVEELVRIQVVGGTEDNVALLDLSKGDFGSRLMEENGGFHFELGAGEDHFMVRGTHGDDNFYAGAARLKFFMSLTENPRLNVWVEMQEKVTYSLGPGDDVFSSIGRLNVGLYDVDTGASLQPTSLDFPVRGFGGTGDDDIIGGTQSDVLAGGPGDDIVSALEGNDSIDEGPDSSGADVINGGPGLDTVSYQWRVEDLYVELCNSPELYGCSGECACPGGNGEKDEGDTLVNLETVRAGVGNDTLIGTESNDFLFGEEGDDLLVGGDGSDLLQGGLGKDELQGGENEDICDAADDEVAVSCEI